MGPTMPKSEIDLEVEGTPRYSKGKQRRRKGGGVSLDHCDFSGRARQVSAPSCPRVFGVSAAVLVSTYSGTIGSPMRHVSAPFTQLPQLVFGSDR